MPLRKVVRKVAARLHKPDQKTAKPALRAEDVEICGYESDDPMAESTLALKLEPSTVRKRSC